MEFQGAGGSPEGYYRGLKWGGLNRTPLKGSIRAVIAIRAVIRI